MDQLRYWLKMSSWNADEAVWILAGLDPFLSPSSEKHGWWLLPGTAADLDSHEMGQRFLVLKFLANEERAEPEKFIMLALRKNYWVPWLEIAARDQKCRLSSRLRARVIKRYEERRNVRRNIDRRNVMTAARHDQYRDRAVKHGQEIIDSLVASGSVPMWGGRPNISAIIRRIMAEEPPAEFSSETYRDWLEDGKLMIIL